MKSRYYGTAINWNLFSEAQRGNQKAVQTLARIASSHIHELALCCDRKEDDESLFTIDVFDAIADGVEPNTAFLKLAGIVSSHIRDMSRGYDLREKAATPFIIDLFDAVASGVEPNTAFRKLAGIVSSHMRSMSLSCDLRGDAATPFITDVFDAIANGTEPNIAFGWKRARGGRSSESLPYRDWYIARCIDDLIENHGFSLGDAKSIVGAAVAKEWERHGSTIDKIYKAYSGQQEMPEELPPSFPEFLKTTTRLDAAVEKAIAKSPRQVGKKSLSLESPGKKPSPLESPESEV